MKLRLIQILTALLLAMPCQLYAQHEREAKQYHALLSPWLAMPDQADYSDSFYEKNYLISLQALHELQWDIPDDIFRHFVLPVRVNNENLDMAREVFYNELKDRVKGLSMEQAILEVNHWCHEKVSYRPSDARTSSPLATVRTAYGRCGEESTLLVAALRSVAIPARQVYTPRWAHTDDNHAWVEAWANGQWHFLGACEPEPVLDLGWFNESASRAMLMHTKVAGDYHGPEEVMSRTACYTEINVTGNYAPTTKVEITIIDKNGAPVKDALVEFKLYNYAEFYTVAKKTTDSEGHTSLTAGKGDLLVWVTKGDLVAQKKVSWREAHTETIVLDDSDLPDALDLDIVPPQAHFTLPAITQAQRDENNRRKAQEDSIRQAYEATMPVEAWRGNHATINRFIAQSRNKVMARKLLDVISEKDLRDVTLDVLMDNVVTQTDTSELFCRYIMCPRVENEWLTPYKAFFRKEFKGKISSLDQLIDWTRDNIVIDGQHNPQGLRQQPMSVYRTRKTDKLGRAIFFVSAARSLGFPARINEVDGKLEFYIPFHGGQWREVNFEEGIFAKPTKYGALRLNFMPSGERSDLSYYTHFTLSRIVNGTPQLLTFPEDATWSNTFKEGVTLEPGTYLLTTGNRLSNGNVLAHITRFSITPNEFTQVDLKLREETTQVSILGNIDPHSKYLDLNTGNETVLLPNEGYGIIGFIAPSHEPTNHALRDIAVCTARFEENHLPVTLLTSTADEMNRLNRAEFANLPSTVRWGIDTANMLEQITSALQLQATTLPVFLICDKAGNIYFIQQGYTIHLGDQLLKTHDQIGDN
ncbi:MAG: transglutaminase domain-containing protein [Muribaculaceae bacterium]|nr:transglutaminase domain-containing protein [Muribaculaceae bacterium]